MVCNKLNACSFFAQLKTDALTLYFYDRHYFNNNNFVLTKFSLVKFNKNMSFGVFNKNPGVLTIGAIVRYDP